MNRPHRVAAIAALVFGLFVAGAIWSQWEDWFVKPELRASLERTLKDAESVQYRSESVSRAGTNLCGEFNAKNGYGGYAGFKRFIAEPNRHIVEGDPPSTWYGDDTNALIKHMTMTNAQAFEELWRGRCQAA